MDEGLKRVPEIVRGILVARNLKTTRSAQFPGSNAFNLRKFNLYPTATFDAILRSGRAVIFAVYTSTFERGDGMESDVSDTSSTWRDLAKAAEDNREYHLYQFDER